MSENKQFNSVEVICDKILSEARDYEKEQMTQAEAEAAELARRYGEKAQEVRQTILDQAKRTAESRLAAAQSARAMRARNNQLQGRVELLERAYDRAAEKLMTLNREEYLALFVPYVKKAAAEVSSGEISLYVGAGAPVDAQELLLAAESPTGVVAAGIKKSLRSGFCLENGEICLDCSAEALINSIKAETEGEVASILFQA